MWHKLIPRYVKEVSTRFEKYDCFSIETREGDFLKVKQDLEDVAAPSPTLPLLHTQTEIQRQTLLSCNSPISNGLFVATATLLECFYLQWPCSVQQACRIELRLSRDFDKLAHTLFIAWFAEIHGLFCMSHQIYNLLSGGTQQAVKKKKGGYRGKVDGYKSNI